MKIQTVKCAQCGLVVNYDNACIFSDGEYFVCDPCVDEECPISYDYEQESNDYGVVEKEVKSCT
jgi:hypothetical protein